MSRSPTLRARRRKKVALFEDAHDFVIQGGSFVANADAAKKIDIGQLFKLVSQNAILNAGGRADEVRCYPGTREEVIGKVEEWMNRVQDGSCKNRIMWLTGPAGAGKSAICQTIAERCPMRGQQAANFFFFRGDQTRNLAQPLVPTLAYQLRRLYPNLDALLADCLTADPLICKASIADQFHHLISSPMKTIQQSSPTRETIVLFVDGLDECDDRRKQDEILTALRELVDADQSPFLVLIASRAEPHLVMSFNRFGTLVESIFLDDKYRPRDDIRRFIAAKFDEIKRVHHLRYLLPKNWPSKSDIDAITDKSSGQFIYAATVMRLIQYSPESPSLILATTLDVRTSASHNPLPQLDAVYSYILSKASNIQSVKLILCAYFIIDWRRRNDLGDHHRPDFEDLLQLVGYGLVEINSLFANLQAIIRIAEDPLDLVFYHASMNDYLKDKGRSGNYHVDMSQIAAELSAICFRNFWNEVTFDLLFRVQPLAYVNEATAELSKSLLDASRRLISPLNPYVMWDWERFLQAIERLYLQSDRKLFKNLLRG